MQTQVLKADSKENIRLAADLIRRGETVAFPTETVYGLGADATDKAAVAKIFTAKGRPTFDPIIVHVASIAMLPTVVNGVPEVAWQLIDTFWPRIPSKHSRLTPPGLRISGGEQVRSSTVDSTPI